MCEVNASPWPYRAACAGPKPGQSDMRPASSARPAATRRTEERKKKNILCFPTSTYRPQPCPFSCFTACFQENSASCMMEWWMRGGRGGRDREEKADTHIQIDGDGGTAVCTQ